MKFMKQSYNYLDKIDNKNKAYIIGFYLSSGIIKNKTLSFTSIDYNSDILYKIKNELKNYFNENIINLKKYKTTKSENVFIKLLIKHEYICNKFKNCKDIIEKISDDIFPSFIRGYFDGCGCISFSKINKKVKLKNNIEKIYTHINCQWNIVSSDKIIIEKISDFLNKQDIYVYTFKENRHNNFLVYTASFNEIKKIYKLLYNNDDLYRKLKKEKFEQLMDIKISKKISKNYWTKEKCFEESKKYKSRTEFCKKCNSAYLLSLNNGWLDDMTWLILTRHKNGYWTKEKCFEESKKYKSRTEFRKKSNQAYVTSRINNWLIDMIWLKESSKPNGYWTKEKCFEESKKYSSRSEFLKKCIRGYRVSLNNGWLDDMIWLKSKPNLFKTGIGCIYSYEFSDYNCVYVGLTISYKNRDKQHRTNKNSSVYKFSNENNIKIPDMKILETNLLPIECQKQELFYVEKYKKEGWILLNKSKCGENCSALGKIKKWTKKKCFEESKKYSSRKEFYKKSNQAYKISRDKGWLSEMTWLGRGEHGQWTKDECFEESKKYKTISEFRKYSSGAYYKSKRNNWLIEMYWLTHIKKKPQLKWTKEKCLEESKKYKNRKEFKNKCSGAYASSKRNGWLDEMFPKNK